MFAGKNQMANYLTKLFTIALYTILCNAIYAQPNKGEFINVSIGLGICAPYDASDIDGTGFYTQAEYVWSPTTWFGVRPYAGVIIASGESDVDQPVKESIKSNAALLGTKIRLAAPIPYVAPYLESGVGMSIGSFETHTQYVDLKKSGVLLHIPVTLGLAVGRNHNYEIKFTYYYHNAVEQFSGAAALGFTFPLDN